MNITAKKDYNQSFYYKEAFDIQYNQNNCTVGLTFAAAVLSIKFTMSIENLTGNLVEDFLVPPASK